MREFTYVRAAGVGQAVAAVSADPGADYLAGGTTQLDQAPDESHIVDQALIDQFAIRGWPVGEVNRVRSVRVG